MHLTRSKRARALIFAAIALGLWVRPAHAAGDDDAQRKLLGKWRTHVTGGTWTTPGPTQDTAVLHVSPGGPEKALTIKPDGTYEWDAYGGKKGRWIKGDAEWPIVLVDTSEKKQWKVALDPKRTGGRDIVIWDGDFYSYDGKR